MYIVCISLQRLAIDRTEPHRFASATKEANKGKNRFINIMPCELILLLNCTSSLSIYVRWKTDVMFTMYKCYVPWFLTFLDEYNRVKLNFMRGVDGSDYINASFVDVSH